MIFLKPIGGLCNRIRAMDSALTLCKHYRQNLTILWINDFTLNCAFEKIFVIPKVENFEFQIVECPYGFPELYLSSPGYAHPALNQFIQLNNRLFNKQPLNETQKSILNEIQKISIFNFVNNNSLYKIYSSKIYIDTLSVTQMDNIFIKKISEIIQPLFSTKISGFISSCYRFHPIENNYLTFIPVKNIGEKVKYTEGKFNNTIGIHIRRSDHKISKKFSTTEKFINFIEYTNNVSPNTTFFLSTDDKILKENFVSRFGSKIITNHIKNYSRNEADAIKDAVIDLFCLSKTKKIVGSHHSTFSQVAADIGKIKEITIK